VSPREIEDVISRMPQVVDVAVIGIPDPVLGHAIKAVVRRATGASPTAREVMAYCADHLEDFLVPTVVEFRDTLPTTESGKISRQALRTES